MPISGRVLSRTIIRVVSFWNVSITLNVLVTAGFFFWPLRRRIDGSFVALGLVAGALRGVDLVDIVRVVVIVVIVVDQGVIEVGLCHGFRNVHNNCVFLTL